MPAKSEVLLLLIHGFLDKGAAWAALIDKLGPLDGGAVCRPRTDG
jgi:hypothetical protein